MKNLAIIPARSGSKGLKDKNIKRMNGKPLMAYTIAAAAGSGKFDEIMVSTDSEIYAEIARQYGAKVPFLRDVSNATDAASSWDVVEEVLEEYRKRNMTFDSFCLLQPTSPLRTSGDISMAYQLFEEKASVAVVSICEAEHSPLWSGKLDPYHSLDGFIPKENMNNRQKGGRFYRINGALYILKTSEFFKDRYLYRDGSYAYVMPAERSIDIDTEMDFKIAEFLMKTGGELKQHHV